MARGEAPRRVAEQREDGLSEGGPALDLDRDHLLAPREDEVGPLLRDVAIGHTRYSTAGESKLGNAQPIVIDCVHGQIGVCHNSATVRDYGVASANQVALGFHTPESTYPGLRLECTANSPEPTSIVNGSWYAWVR